MNCILSILGGKSTAEVVKLPGTLLQRSLLLVREILFRDVAMERYHRLPDCRILSNLPCCIKLHSV